MEIIGSLFEVLVCIGAVVLIMVLIALGMILLLFIGIGVTIIGDMTCQGLKRVWQWLRDEVFLLYCFWRVVWEVVKFCLREIPSERELILKNKRKFIKKLSEFQL